MCPIMYEKEAKQLPDFLSTYICLEKEVSRRVRNVSRPFCTKCSDRCCQEIFCRESRESAFLSRIIGLQRVKYDPEDGWMGAHGCRLDSGKPLVCHDFFCSDILSSPSFEAAGIQALVKGFAGIGDKAYGNLHLMCIDDLNVISAKKIYKMTRKMEQLSGTWPAAGARRLPIGEPLRDGVEINS